MAAFGIILCASILVAVIAAFYDQVAKYKKESLNDFALCAGLSALGFLVTYYFIPIVKEIMLRNQMWGYDINKNGREMDIKMYEKRTMKRRSECGSRPLNLIYTLLASIFEFYDLALFQ